jgi:UDP-glucuronate 4-epimerase
MNHDHIMVTGAAGFIGSSLCEALLAQGRQVTGIENFSPNYAEATKRENLRAMLTSKRFTLVECDVGSEGFRRYLSSNPPDVIIHLAATPGVRPSVEYVLEYVDNNVRATANLLASAASAGISKIVFASSSSVYGEGLSRPVREDDALVPLSPYAATKVSGEALCRSFVASHGMSVTCLRFFTVYGPRQRPDMAICKLAHCINSGSPFQMNGDGKSSRDYTYISDIVSGICASLNCNEPFEVFNLGSGNPIDLLTMIKLVSEALGRTPILESAELPSSEPKQTYADISKAVANLGYKPSVNFRDGVAQFAAWFAESQKRGMA